MARLSTQALVNALLGVVDKQLGVSNAETIGALEMVKLSVWYDGLIDAAVDEVDAALEEEDAPDEGEEWTDG